MSLQPFACLGHSHVRSVAVAVERRGVAAAVVNLWRYRDPVTVIGGRRRFRDPVPRLLGDRPVFSMLCGANHHTLSLLTHPRPFDFVLPSAPELPLAEVEVVPFDLVHAALADLMAPHLDLIDVLHSSHPYPIVQIEAPPLSADAERLTPQLDTVVFYRKGAKLGSLSLRVKMWRLHSEILREFCAARGIPVMPPPPAATDERGFLREEYYLDPVHVNDRYGDLLVTQMIEHLQEMGVDAPR